VRESSICTVRVVERYARAMKYARIAMLIIIAVIFAWGIFHTRPTAITPSPGASVSGPVPSMPVPASDMTKSPAAAERFDGMIFPVEAVSSLNGATPSPERHPLDTVWCGSYYYFPSSYSPRNGDELKRFSSRSAGSGSHPGVDIALPVGTPVKAVAAGAVVFCEWRVGWGNLVVIEHNIPHLGTVYSCYGHLSSITAAKGPVKKGAVIGYSGSSGAPYPHLHFQIDRNSFPYYPDSTGAFPYTSPLHPVNRLDSIEQVKKNTFEPLSFIACHKK